MILTIISIILAIAAFIFLGFTEVHKEGMYRPVVVFKLNKKQLLAILPLILIAFNLFTRVPANHVGILYSPFTGVKEETVSEGFRRKGIFDKVYKINTEVQSKALENITGQTKDAQYITMMVDVKYKVDKDTAFQVFRQYRNLDNVSNNLIAPTVQRSIETVSTQYNVIDVLGEYRNELYKGIEIELKNRLAENGIAFVSINFTDTDAGAAIEQAIQAEAIAKKAVETAEQERQKAEIEAQKAVVTAKAEKEAAVIRAETRKIEAEAEAEVNRKMAESTTPLVIQRMEMQARLKHGWITTTVSGSAAPIINTGN